MTATRAMQTDAAETGTIATNWHFPPVRTKRGRQGGRGGGRRAARGPRTRGQARSFQCLQASFERDHRAAYERANVTAIHHAGKQHSCESNPENADTEETSAAGVMHLEPCALGWDGRGPCPRGQARRAALALAPGSRESRGNTKTNKAWEESGLRDGTGGAQDAHRSSRDRGGQGNLFSHLTMQGPRDR